MQGERRGAPLSRRPFQVPGGVGDGFDPRDELVEGSGVLGEGARPRGVVRQEHQGLMSVVPEQ